MPNIQEWIQLYSSKNREVKLRAAQGILERAEQAPLALLIEILETLSHEGLGAKAERALLKRSDAELVPQMISLLDASDGFVREAACNILGRFGDKAAVSHLLRMIDDPVMMVRRAAGFSLSFLKDPSSLPELRAKHEEHRDDDSNVLMAIKCAFQSLGEIEN
jgi:HEAT repeat protein